MPSQWRIRVKIRMNFLEQYRDKIGPLNDFTPDPLISLIPAFTWIAVVQPRGIVLLYGLFFRTFAASASPTIGSICSGGKCEKLWLLP
jgi:hypothetical protein